LNYEPTLHRTLSFFNKLTIKCVVGWLGGEEVDLHLWGSKGQFSQMTWVVINNGMLIEYSLFA
jgi:hypothetical protein